MTQSTTTPGQTCESLEMNQGRAAEFERSDNLEGVLSIINESIKTAVKPPYARPKYPVIVIVGNARSGTTLALQWLAATGHFAYPSNLLARFYSNPYFGALTQQALADFDPSEQIGLSKSYQYSSALGKTDGALAPSEFWYFWRRFFAFGEKQQLSPEALENCDTAAFLEGLAGIEAAFDKPVVLKGMIMNWHISFLDEILDKVIFLNMERDDFFTGQSLYFARERFFGDASKWYSFKPAEYDQLIGKSPLAQVAGQIHYTGKAVRHELEKVPDTRQLTLQYEAFCRTPKAAYEAIQSRMAAQGFALDDIAEQHTKAFPVSKTVKLSTADAQTLRAEFDHYAAKSS